MGWIALAMAVFGALSYGVGSILQAIGAMRSSGTVRTLGHPLYLLGVGCDLLAWAASMVALRELAVYQVQSVLAGSLAVTVVAARLILASRLRGRDVAAVIVTIGALTVLAASAGPQEAVMPSGPLRLAFCMAAAALALIGFAAAKVAPPGVVAALAGTSFGAAALCGRALPMPEESPNAAAFMVALLLEPFTLALVTFAATGMLLYTNALRNGQVGPVTAVLWIGEVIAPSVVGLLLLGDAVRAGWAAPAALAGLVTIGAAAVLGTAPATDTATQAAALEAAGLGQPPHPGRPGVPAQRAGSHAQHGGVPAQRAGGHEQPAAGPRPVHFPAGPARPLPANAAARTPLWPTLAWQTSTPVRPFIDRQTAAIRWWGPPVTDRQAGTFWWWGPPTDPQLIWIPPNRTRWR